MPNKKTKTVKIRHLECFSAIYGELAQNPEYAGYEVPRIRGQGTDRPKDIGENGGREQADRSPVGGTRFHIPFEHRAVGKQIFRNKRSRFPT